MLSQSYSISLLISANLFDKMFFPTLTFDTSKILNLVHLVLKDWFKFISIQSSLCLVELYNLCRSKECLYFIIWCGVPLPLILCSCSYEICILFQLPSSLTTCAEHDRSCLFRFWCNDGINHISALYISLLKLMMFLFTLYHPLDTEPGREGQT